MAQENSQNLLALLGSLTPQQIRALEGVLKSTRSKGTNKFEKARKEAIDGYFAATKIFHDTHVNPDYHYEFQEYPKVLYSVVETENGTEVAWMQFESEDETAELGPEWCANPGLAQQYYKSLSQEEDPQPEKPRRGRPPLHKPQGELVNA